MSQYDREQKSKNIVQKMHRLNDEIEKLIDRHGIEKIICALTQVCAKKADHLRESYSAGGINGWDLISCHFAKVGTRKMEEK